MKWKEIAANGLIAAVAVSVGLLLCEVGARFVLNVADYLSVTVADDPVLGMAIPPGSPGFDEWGFRNASVPSSAAVVTVGDSHTFGNAATMDEAWPSVLSRRLGTSVYNLGVGGYGPNQYYHLLMTRGLKLHPKWVLCGLYMGDDFENAFSITYGLDYWSSLRTGHWPSVNANIWGDSEPPGPFKRVRNWLSRESLLYRLVVHGAVLGSLKESVRFRQVAGKTDPDVTSLELPEKNIREAFRPRGLVTRLDQKRPEVREGMRIAFHLLKAMDQACRENGCTLVVVIIPTKETVFADYLTHAPDLHLKTEVEQVVANESAVRHQLVGFLHEQGIQYVEALPALQRAIDHELYARTTADMHPNGNGYRVIGDTVAEFLRTASPNDPGRP